VRVSKSVDYHSVQQCFKYDAPSRRSSIAIVKLLTRDHEVLPDTIIWRYVVALVVVLWHPALSAYRRRRRRRRRRL